MKKKHSDGVKKLRDKAERTWKKHLSTIQERLTVDPVRYSDYPALCQSWSYGVLIDSQLKVVPRSPSAQAEQSWAKKGEAEARSDPR